MRPIAAGNPRRQAQPFPTKQTAGLRPTAPAVSAAGVPVPTLSKTKFCADLESRGIASCGCRAEPAIPHRVSGQTRLRRATLPTLSKSSDLCSIAVRQSAPTGATVPHQANHRFASYRAGGQRRRRTLFPIKQTADLRRLGVKGHCPLRVWAAPAIPHRVSGQTRLRRATLPTLSKSSDLCSIAVRQSAPTGATVPHQANHRFAPINFSLSPRIFIPPSLPRLPRRRRPRIFRDPPDLCTPRSDRPAAKRTVCRA